MEYGPVGITMFWPRSDLPWCSQQSSSVRTRPGPWSLAGLFLPPLVSEEEPFLLFSRWSFSFSVEHFGVGSAGGPLCFSSDNGNSGCFCQRGGGGRGRSCCAELGLHTSSQPNSPSPPGAPLPQGTIHPVHAPCKAPLVWLAG